MAKVVFGEYAAFRTQGGIRFQKDNKLAAEKNLPPEVVEYLKKQLGEDTKQYQNKDEEIKKAKEESLKNLDSTPDERQERLTPQDFDEDIPAEITTTNPPNELNVIEAPEPDEMSDFMESVSIHTASLEDIAQAIYERFGIYTVYLNKLPTNDEVNPLTGEAFTKYHQGIAYQAAIRAQQSGLLSKDPEAGRKQIDQNLEAHKNFQDQFVPIPGNMAAAAQQNSFKYRTAPEGTRTVPTTEVVHVTQPDGSIRAERRDIPVERRKSNAASKQTNDLFTDEPIVEPRFGQKVVRPDW